jgi:hypothetical protein
VTLVGTEDVEVASSLFTRLDGNAVFIGGYNRGLTIDSNEFVFIGDTAIAAWGDTSTRLNANGSLSLPYPIGPDGRGGDQPRGTRVTNNLVHEIGLWQKQSSLYFQAVAAQTLVKGNVFFNGPRAALNFKCVMRLFTVASAASACVGFSDPLTLYHSQRRLRRRRRDH